MELRIYIAGKVTGEDRATCEAKFQAVETKLKSLGVDVVINPLKLGIPIGKWSRKDEMDLCLKVLHEKANAIYLISDWVDSDGAKNEYIHAYNFRYRIFEEGEFDEISNLLKHSGKWADTSYAEFP